MRIAVIGARRRRQGTGGYLAGFLAAEGCEIAAVLGTTPETVQAAVEGIAAGTGQTPHGFTDARAMFAGTRPDAVVIASPHPTHAEYLALSLQARAHVLCEKPVCWGGETPSDEAEAFGAAYLKAGLHLRINAQWPQTLPTYRELAPTALAKTPQRFWMHMSPSGTGLAMLLDSLPHPLSLLNTVLPDPDAELRDIHIESADPSNANLVVCFDLVAAGAVVSCEIQLVQSVEQPRPAAYGFNGHDAHRDVTLSPFQLHMTYGDRRVPLPDPTPLLVRSFLDDVAGGPPTAIDPSVRPGMRQLRDLCAAFHSPREIPAT